LKERSQAAPIPIKLMATARAMSAIVPELCCFIDDVLRAPFHDFIPLFWGPDYLGGNRYGGECGFPSSGMR
jgi:hypothetical protein